MDGGLTVTLISVAMFVGCFLLGFTPLLFRLSEKSLQLVCILGAGLLCGTALAIAIPEGVTQLTALSSLPVPHSRVLIGLALTFGFTLMFVVDQISTYLSIRGLKGVNITATVGLVIHAAADGFALGAAAATGQVTVQVVIFLAVILHKAPAAFGLVSFLMHSGLEKKHIQGHLLAFSAAAPVFTIATYFILQASGSSTQSQLTSTGVGMLFSAGTFLYVATVHILPEVSSSAAVQKTSDLQLEEGAEGHQQQPLGLTQSITLIIGVGLPVALALGLKDD
uniref:Zinc transporter ZIP9 n=1 Tax=Takifugu rubripes TaxID=31033 RepID=A0A3B5K6C5_TAKRU